MNQRMKGLPGQGKPSAQRVMVAMSGGVDSSLAASLLKEKGYNVWGITMKLWEFKDVGGDIYKDGRCCSLEAMDDARGVCAQIGIPHYVLDFKEEFKDRVISVFVEEYKKGRTPNPCILCNTEIKWRILWHKACELGADFLATGHYAQIKYDEKDKRYSLLKGKDPTKDQSYALWGLCQKNLSHTIFPLGDLDKSQVREKAKEHGLKIAFKTESQEICFVPDNDYPRFIREWVNTQGVEISPGPILDLEGKKIGEHKGIVFYTIGQRKGLGISTGKPLYVVKIDEEKNCLYVGGNQDLFKSAFSVSHLNWIAIPELDEKIKCEVKIRYLSSPAKAEISPLTKDEVLVKFEKPQRAITPGQSAVFYENNSVLGGGIIEEVKEI